MDNTTAAAIADESRANFILNGKVTLFSIIVLLVALIIILCFHSYSRRRSNRRHRRRNPLPLSRHDSAGTQSQGLDLFTLKSLPIFAFSSVIHDPLLECAVCISEFQNDEIGRVLPKCNHAFHVQCIDMWFDSHSNCPICRTPVVNSSENSVVTVFSVDEFAGSIPEFNSVSGQVVQKEESETGSSSSSPSSPQR